MTGIIISALSILAAAYLILKKYYAPGALLVVGLVTLGVVACISPDPLVTGKKATHLAGLDVIQIVTNLLQSRSAGLGMNIMAIAGFSAYMDRIGASKALLRLSVKPLTYVRSPYIVMTMGLALSIGLNIFIPSAAGLALLLMVSLYPILVAAGISRQSAGATILISGCLCLGPSGPNNLLAADLTKMHVMDFFLNVQWTIAWLVVVVILFAHYFTQRWFDQKDLASGRITKEDFVPPQTAETEDKERPMPIIYALFPLVPVIMLFVFSPLMYKAIRMEVVTAILTSTLIAFAIDALFRRDFRESIGQLKSYAQGMGKVFSSTVFLIVCAEVFATGLTKSGGIAAIISSVSTMDSGAIAVFTVMFLIVAGASLVTGSGNASFFSFAPMIPDAAAAFGANAAFMISPLQLVSGMARSSSPVAGVTIAVSGLSGVEPFTLVRRSIPVMALAIVTTYLHAIMMI
ncbi:MAG: C4-dicarboxylate transporter DcuC [Sutterella sp.]|nr:C4-dicarboxylate transporter DcuC [Sutterella sp.]